MNDRAQSIADELARNRAHFERFCRSLTTEELATPVPDAPWTVHGYIAHLATIDSLIAPWFGPFVGISDIPRPEVAPGQPFDIDDWNEAVVPRRTERNVDELFAEAAVNRANMVRTLEKMTDTHLDAMIPFGGDRKKIDLPPVPLKLESLLWGIALHDITHARDILRALPAREPAVHDWLESGDFSRVSPEVLARRV